MISNQEDLVRYSISIQDFDLAKEFADLCLGQDPESRIFAGLQLAAIVAYCRPFSPNEKNTPSGAASSIEVSAFSLTPLELALHEECKKLRNRVLAHSEHAHNPVTTSAENNVVITQHYPLPADSVSPADLSALCQKLAGYCEAERRRYIVETAP